MMKRTLIIAEAGVNHNGDLALAKQLIESAAKAGAEGFSRALARELGSRSVTVNCVAPGFMHRAAFAALHLAAVWLRTGGLRLRTTGRTEFPAR